MSARFKAIYVGVLKHTRVIDRSGEFWIWRTMGTKPREGWEL